MRRQLFSAAAMVLVMAVLTGLLYPVVITGLARVLFPSQAQGSLVVRGGNTVGSTLIGQSFIKPEYFHPRPSAAGSGYDGTSSGGTNLGPTSAKLLKGIHKKPSNGKDDPGNFDGVADLAAAYRAENGLPAGTLLPADAVTRSASGLDPEISPENATLQVVRVARARRMSEERMRRIVAAHVQPRQLGFLGEPCVNVLRLNMDLDGIPASATIR